MFIILASQRSKISQYSFFIPPITYSFLLLYFRNPYITILIPILNYLFHLMVKYFIPELKELDPLINVNKYLLSSFFRVIKHSMLPKGIQISNKKMDDINMCEFIINHSAKNDKDKELMIKYLQSILITESIFQGSGYFLMKFNDILNGKQINNIKTTIIKNLFTLFLAEPLMVGNINIFRTYKNAEYLRKIQRVIEYYKIKKMNNQKLPHLIFFGEMGQLFCLCSLFSSTFAKVNINNIELDKTDNSFQRESAQIGKTNLDKRLCGQPSFILNNNWLAVFVLTFLSLAEEAFSTTEYDFTINLIKAENLEKDTKNTLNYLKTLFLVNSLNNRNKTDTVFALCSNQISSEIVLGLFDNIIFCESLSFEEFSHLFRVEFLNFFSLNGLHNLNILADRDISYVIYRLTEKTFNIISSQDLKVQKNYLNSLFAYIQSSKKNLEEILNVL